MYVSMLQNVRGVLVREEAKNLESTDQTGQNSPPNMKHPVLPRMILFSSSLECPLRYSDR